MRPFWNRLIQPLTFTLHPRHVVVLALLLIANITLVVVVTVIIVQALTPTPPMVFPPTPTLLSLDAINTEVALRFPTALPPVATPTLPPPTATALGSRNPLAPGGTIFMAYRQNGRTNLWAQELGQTEPVRLTAGPWDDREPALSPDGHRLAFSSRREGAWNLYVIDLQTGDLSRLTSGSEFKGHPSWSPDGQWVVFEIYRNNNLDIAVQNVGDGQRFYLTADPAADYSPVWSPAGRSVIWVSMRSNKPELWTRSLDDPLESASVQLTNLPDILPSDPAYSPDGTHVLFTDAVDPLLLVYSVSALTPNDKPLEIGQGHHPQWSPDGSSLLSIAPQETGLEYVLAAPITQPGLAQIAFRTSVNAIHSMVWGDIRLPETLPTTLAQAAQISDAPLWNETVFRGNSDPPYSLMPLRDVNAPDARLSDQVDDSFYGLQRASAQAVGWDFLGNLDNALISIREPLPPSVEQESWLKAGRAFDIAQAAAQAGWLEITREDRGFRTYWRVWVRTRVQDGTQGEPLRTPPWDFSARYSLRPQPYDEGGEYYTVMPPGYFVDFTEFAGDYGWARVPAQDNWRSFYPGLLFWRFEKRDGLDWLNAIREVYRADQAATWTPFPSPTSTPTITGTPTETPIPSDTPTPTRTQTRTPRPTFTPTITLTPRPTRTPTITFTPRPIVITVIITVTSPPRFSPTPTETERAP